MEIVTKHTSNNDGKSFLLLVLPFIALLWTSTTLATDRRGRLGIGMSNQLKNNLPSISFKLQRSKSMALGGLLAYNSEDGGGGYGAGLKLYRNFFEEPQLNFYGSVMGALLQRKRSAMEDDSGFQADIAFGSEFHFSGLRSLGFSFEFGVTFSKLDDFVIETSGDSFIVSSIHFYL